MYIIDQIYSDYYYDLKGRVHFTTNDVASGNASIKIRTVRPSDSGTYQCRVKKAPGVAKTTIQLTVVGKSLLLLEQLLSHRVKGHSTKSQHLCKTNMAFTVIIVFIYF